MVDNIFGHKKGSVRDESEELKKGGTVQAKRGIQELSDNTALSTNVLLKEETIVGFLGRKLFEVIKRVHQRQSGFSITQTTAAYFANITLKD